MNLCVYPGSFDPITKGHLDIIERCIKIFGKVIVAVGNNENKKPLFSTEERISLIRSAVNGDNNVQVEPFTGLLVDFVRARNAAVVVKGLRAVTDFEYEFQMALINKNLAPEIETLFMVTNINYSYLSSSLVKEIASNNGKIDGLVPDCIKSYVMEKFNHTVTSVRGLNSAGGVL